MESWQIALLLKPLGLLILFTFVFFLARGIGYLLPEGKLKRFLFYRWKV